MASKDDVEIRDCLTRVESVLAGHIGREEEQMEKVITKLDTIEIELSRYRGVVGGILLVVTAIVTFVKMFGEEVANFFAR